MEELHSSILKSDVPPKDQPFIALPNSDAISPDSVGLEGESASLSDRWSKQRGYGICAGGVNILLPVGVYSELAFDPVITALPNSPQFFVGLLNMRGNLIPVYDLAAYIHLVEHKPSAELDYKENTIFTPSKINQVVVLGRGDDSAALLCDGLPQTLELSINALSEKNTEIPSSIKPFVSRSFWLKEAWWFELDIISTFTFLAQEPSF